jgi:ADP-ribose pyrophosphatase YjhB (NUDIX family)
MSAATSIRSIALALLRRGDRILVLEGTDPANGARFYRPLGGGIGHGERAADAVVRELKEELGVDVVVRGLYGIYENVFTYNAKPHHEIAFVFDCAFVDVNALGEDEHIGREDDGTPFRVLWKRIDDFARARDGDGGLVPETFAPAFFARSNTDALAFARRQKYGVVSTTSADGSPQSAVVGLAFGDDFEIVFDTLGTSRKAANLRRDERVSIVVWEGERTLQIDGVADEPDGDERERVRAIYFETFPDGRARLSWPSLTHFRVRPTWIRDSDFDTGRIEIVRSERDRESRR